MLFRKLDFFFGAPPRTPLQESVLRSASPQRPRSQPLCVVCRLLSLRRSVARRAYFKHAAFM
jgi:hypothetical protein